MNSKLAYVFDNTSDQICQLSTLHPIQLVPLISFGLSVRNDDEEPGSNSHRYPHELCSNLIVGAVGRYTPFPWYVISHRCWFHSVHVSLLFVTHSTSSSSSSLASSTVLFDRPVSRAAFVTALVTTGGFLSPAQAAKYGAFGADSTTGGIDRSTAEIDAAILQSAAVKDAIRTIQTARERVTQLQALLQTDPQAVVKSTSVGDPYQLRDALNCINAAFDEDTQRNTDRLIRGVVQDLIEIDTAAAQKAGIARSARRLDTVNQKLLKLARTFDDFLAFTV
jgi:hypothetical protein